MQDCLLYIYGGVLLRVLLSIAACACCSRCKQLMQLTVLQLAACMIHIAICNNMSHQCYPGHADLCRIDQVMQSCPGHAL